MKSNIIISGLLLLSPFVLASDHTNIVLINLDDVGYGDFSCNGAYSYTTPNIDALASEGMRFTHFLAVQPISGASRAGLLTGCYPNRIGFAGAPGPGSKYGIHPEEMTMGELLKQKGYATAIFGKWKVCQKAHLLFLAQSPDFHKLGLCYYLKILYL